MPPNTIAKSLRAGALAPNLDDYERVRSGFTWDQARALLDGLPDGRGLNIAHEAVDRHAMGPRAHHRAIRWLDTLGVGPGDRVGVVAGRIPEPYIAALGTMKHRSVFSPLFSAFGPEPIHTRLALGQIRVLVTTVALYQRKIADIAPEAAACSIEPGVSFRDQLDLDSMDVLNLAVALHAALDVDIPETDYARLSSLDSAVAYLAERLAGSVALTTAA